jgi:hypothetical protein
MALQENQKRGCCALRATTVLTPRRKQIGHDSERFFHQIAEVAATHELPSGRTAETSFSSARIRRLMPRR